MITPFPKIKYIAAVARALVNSGARRATKYVSPTHVVRMTLTTFRGKGGPRRIDCREKSTHISLTIGQPNYLDRKFIKQCKRAGETFPVRKIRLSFPRL